MSPRRGELWWVRLDPTEGSEIRKTRLCLVLTADSLNRLRRTVVVVPFSTSAQAHPPVTVSVTCQGQPAVAQPCHQAKKPVTLDGADSGNRLVR